MPAVARVSGDATGLEAFSKRGQDAFQQLADVGEHRLGRSLFRLTNQLDEAKSVGDALASTAHILERTFSLGLGATIAVAAGVSLYETWKRNTEAMHALGEAADKALKFDTSAERGIASLGAVQSAIEKTEDAIEKIRKGRENVGLIAKGEEIVSLIGYSLAHTREETKAYSDAQIGADKLAQLEKQRAEENRLAADAVQRENVAMQLRLSGDEQGAKLAEIRAHYAEKILDLELKGAIAAAAAMVTQANIAIEIQKQADAKKRANEIRENQLGQAKLGAFEPGISADAQRMRELKLEEDDLRKQAEGKIPGLEEGEKEKLILMADQKEQQREILRLKIAQQNFDNQQADALRNENLELNGAIEARERAIRLQDAQTRFDATRGLFGSAARKSSLQAEVDVAERHASESPEMALRADEARERLDQYVAEHEFQKAVRRAEAEHRRNPRAAISGFSIQDFYRPGQNMSDYKGGAVERTDPVVTQQQTTNQLLRDIHATLKGEHGNAPAVGKFRLN